MLNQVRDLYEQAVDNLSKDNLQNAQEGIRTGAYSVFDAMRGAARNNPKTTAAVILGTGLAAAALWVLREPQRFAAVRRGLSQRVRGIQQLAANRTRRPSD
jgi:hypothetical protein